MRLTPVVRRECFTAAALLALAPVWQPAAHATTADRVDPETGKVRSRDGCLQQTLVDAPWTWSRRARARFDD